jgi:DNA-3-methyladenine glycosylase II
MSAEPTFSIEPRGPFTLASAARFIAGWPPASKGDRELDDTLVRLAFLVDDWSGHAGVVLRQDGDGTVRGEIVESTAADPGRVHAQAARILSLDHDATGYAALGDRDPVIGELQRASPRKSCAASTPSPAPRSKATSIASGFSHSTRPSDR